MNLEDFPMLKKDIIYLDNGATTLKPQCVIDKMRDYYENYSANAHRGDYDISYKVDQEYENARELVRKFINAKYKEEIIFTSGATQSLNMIAFGFFGKFLEAGDEVLITQSEHASNVIPWFILEKKLGIVVRYIPLDDDHYVTIENVRDAITPRTKVISLACITNVLGDERPIKEICELAHQNNIFVVMDAAQSVPHRKTDVEELDVDFLAFSGHKMCGPTGVGVLYGKKELLEEMDPQNYGGGMNESFDNANEIYLKELPTRLEAGTPNIAGVIGLGEAIQYLESIGMERISEYEKNLRKYAIDKLIEIPYIDILNLESDSGIISFNVDGVFSQDVAYYLNKYNLCVRAGNHCAKNLKKEVGVSNSLRVSLYFYNTESDIDALVELLKNKEKIMEEMI
ncbi:TPA: cysteine desulfurase [Candidatus Ventrenecus avicola]|nr:cysteine desulfurase [Candidatus Ventrenecus avicola]